MVPMRMSGLWQISNKDSGPYLAVRKKSDLSLVSWKNSDPWQQPRSKIGLWLVQSKNSDLLPALEKSKEQR